MDDIKKIKIFGMHIEKYMQKYLDGKNLKFVEYEQEADRYLLYGRCGDITFKIKMYEDPNHQCYSGYTSATYGVLEIEAINPFQVGEITYRPASGTNKTVCIDFKSLRIDEENTENFVIDDSKDTQNFRIDCDLFSFSAVGGDGYYPSGFVNVFLEKFVREVDVKNARKL